MGKRQGIKILDTDKFFYDSPNTGDPDCICSRCKTQIKEDEVPLRVLVGNTDITTGKGDTIDTAGNGSEFRLCEKCFNEAEFR